jgi:hypothetical protein
VHRARTACDADADADADAVIDVEANEAASVSAASPSSMRTGAVGVRRCSAPRVAPRTQSHGGPRAWFARRGVARAMRDEEVVEDATSTRRAAMVRVSALALTMGVPMRANDWRANADSSSSPPPSSLYDFKVKQYGAERDLRAFDGKVTLVMNVASE